MHICLCKLIPAAVVGAGVIYTFRHSIALCVSGCVTCNKCYQPTKKEQALVDSGYDDYGYQCLACAETSGLADKHKEWNKNKTDKLEKRKSMGIITPSPKRPSYYVHEILTRLGV